MSDFKVPNSILHTPFPYSIRRHCAGLMQ